MVQLTDYSNLRAPTAEKVTIPLNGVNYHALAEVPGGLILDASASKETDDLPDLPPGTTMEDLQEGDTATAVKYGKAGAKSLVRARDFMEAVLEPDSWEQWQTYLAKPTKGMTPAQRKKYLAHMITLPQMLAVFRALLAHYAGRPTKASSSSQNGADATGGTSTDGAPAEA